MVFKKIFHCVFIASAVVITITVCSLFYLRFSMSRPFSDFYSDAQAHFKVPGLDEGFVPQGLHYVSSTGEFLISGYEGNEEKSILYSGGEKGFKKIEVLKDGGKFFCHTGGISTWGDFAYIAGCDGYCYVLSLSDIFDNDNTARVIGAFFTGNNADFIGAAQGKLYIGEYYSPIFFPTDSAHHIKTPCEDEHKAIMAAFCLSEESMLGIDPMPKEIYSIRDSVQGVCITDDGNIVMSSSNNINGAFLTTYSFSSFKASEASFNFQGIELPLYFLDSTLKSSSREILPNSEGIVYFADKIYMLFESASYKFVYGKWLGADYIYSLKFK